MDKEKRNEIIERDVEKILETFNRIGKDKDFDSTDKMANLMTVLSIVNFSVYSSLCNAGLNVTYRDFLEKIIETNME